MDDDTYYDPNTGDNGSPTHPANRRDEAYERRQNILHHKQTDALTSFNNDAPKDKLARRQLVHLREENERLQKRLAEYEQEITTIHNGHQQEVEDYQDHLQDVMDERNHLQEALQQMERRYQELYHSFQGAVEDEAQHMLAEAARTIELHPESRPPVLRDAMKTVELRIKQMEEKQVGETLYLMRQAEKKSGLLEYELAQERQRMADERQDMHNRLENMRGEVVAHKKKIEARFRLRHVVMLTSLTTTLLLLLPLFQLISFSLFHFDHSYVFYIALFGPLVLCMILVALYTYIRSYTHLKVAITPPKPKQEKAPG
jgi:hypothetical protein